MKFFFTKLILLTFALQGMAYADEPAPNIPMVTASSNGRYFFKMVPVSTVDEGVGVTYQIQEDGTFKEIWRTEGWYSLKVFLSDDGHYLVRMGPWSSGHEPEKDDLALAFYKGGKMVREYSTADLVKNKSKVIRSVSHYIWLARDVEPKLSRNIFYLKTIDGISYSFDITTGNVLTKKP